MEGNNFTNFQGMGGSLGFGRSIRSQSMERVNRRLMTMGMMLIIGAIIGFAIAFYLQWPWGTLIALLGVIVVVMSLTIIALPFLVAKTIGAVVLLVGAALIYLGLFTRLATYFIFGGS